MPHGTGILPLTATHRLTSVDPPLHLLPCARRSNLFSRCVFCVQYFLPRSACPLLRHGGHLDCDLSLDVQHLQGVSAAQGLSRHTGYRGRTQSAIAPGLSGIYASSQHCRAGSSISLSMSISPARRAVYLRWSAEHHVCLLACLPLAVSARTAGAWRRTLQPFGRISPL